jgi:hypothetical protein
VLVGHQVVVERFEIDHAGQWDIPGPAPRRPKLFADVCVGNRSLIHRVIVQIDRIYLSLRHREVNPKLSLHMA